MLFKMMPFYQWLEERHETSRSAFGSLSFKQKKKMFLRWKWRSNDDNGNDECESTRRSLYHSFLEEYNAPDFNKDKDEYSRSLENIVLFEKKCYDLQKELGIIDRPVNALQKLTEQVEVDFDN